MANVCVITGGGSGMGLEAAKFMPKDKVIVLSGRTVSKLEGAVKELEALGFTAYAKACDTSNRESVKELAAFAASLGEIKNVINAAGVSPAMKGCQQIV
jgi:short-subunit dehydrogenase